MRPVRIAVAASALCLAALTGCTHTGGGPSPSPSASAPSASAPGNARTRIVIKDFVYRPATLTVRPGTKITVVNEDSAPHTVTATGAGKPFDTGNLAQGQSAVITAPTKPGSYPYICTVHPYMKGTLTVR
ncbi:cupredoxin domain-containing protein [Streptomyces sp. YGL11-2]|uniref:cupredoxin domain-containing protein n=1 Tax=Streptomyces sp. YGL11-2 TaxID=3414028 RepID=UPI003CF7BB79